MLTSIQRQALMSGQRGRVRTPATGAYRLRGGSEVDNVWCFNKRTIEALVGKGYLEAVQLGGYITTTAGKAAVKP